MKAGRVKWQRRGLSNLDVDALLKLRGDVDRQLSLVAESWKSSFLVLECNQLVLEKVGGVAPVR